MDFLAVPGKKSKLSLDAKQTKLQNPQSDDAYSYRGISPSSWSGISELTEQGYRRGDSVASESSVSEIKVSDSYDQLSFTIMHLTSNHVYTVFTQKPKGQSMRITREVRIHFIF